MNNNMNQNNHNKTIPWVEKYRPSKLNDIVLDPLNKSIIERIIETNHFPNILLYGPPGTGKTTLALAIAGENSEIPMFKLNAPEIVSGVSGQSEEKIR